MAQGRVEIKETEKLVKTKEETFILELSRNEAQFLLDLFGVNVNMGSHPANTIYIALSSGMGLQATKKEGRFLKPSELLCIFSDYGIKFGDQNAPSC